MRCIRRLGISTLVLLMALCGPIAALGASGDCGQPASAGSLPTAGDALTALKDSIGQATACDSKPCICDVDHNGSVTASDALLILKKAVGHAVVLDCVCEPPCEYVPFTATADDIVEALGSRLDPSGDFDVLPACADSVLLCCPGGSPVSPCGPIHFDFVPHEGEQGPTLTQLSDPDQFAFDIPVRVNTLSDLPVTVPIVGQCGLAIDTAAGTSPRIDIVGTMEFSPDRISMTPVGPITINNLTTDDLALTGSLSCTAANSFLGLGLDLLRQMIEEQLALSAPLCRQCETLELVQCAG